MKSTFVIIALLIAGSSRSEEREVINKSNLKEILEDFREKKVLKNDEAELVEGVIETIDTKELKKIDRKYQKIGRSIASKEIQPREYQISNTLEGEQILVPLGEDGGLRQIIQNVDSILNP